MRGLRAWWLRLVGSFRQERPEQELAEELRSHLRLHMDENMRAGMSPEQARRDALPKLGGVEATKDVYRRCRALEGRAGYWGTGRTVPGEGEPSVLDGAAVSSNFFQQLGTGAENGRLLSEGDQKPGMDHVAVISDRLWRTRFASTNAILGRKLILSKEIYTIVGVAAKNFTYPDRTDIWVPLLLTPEIAQNRTFFRLQIIGTLRQGEALEQLQAQLGIIAEEFPKMEPRLGKDFKLTAQPLLENAVGDARENYLVLLGATASVLLIACANLTRLLPAPAW